MKIKTIAIVGLGLMGGSLAAACKKKFPQVRIVGVSRSAHARRLALKKKWVHEAHSTIDQGIPKADLIVLCTPLDTLMKLFAVIAKKGKPGVLVTDVGSTKVAVCKLAEQKFSKRFQFVGAHPMVGSHLKGIKAAQPNLYDHGFTFLIHSKKPSAKAYKAVKAFWQKISPKVVEMKAVKHDQVVAEVSHLPHIAALGLIKLVSSGSLKYASRGFLDTTRVAAGDPSIWVPIFQTNRSAILRTMTQFERQLKIFRRCLQLNQAKELKKLVGQASRERSKIHFEF